MTNRKSYRERSKNEWYRNDNEHPTTDQLQLGCLQRIADATEAIAKNHLELQKQFEVSKEEADRYYRWYQEGLEEIEALKRSIRSHKANYTRIKRKLEAKKDESAD